MKNQLINMYTNNQIYYFSEQYFIDIQFDIFS